MNKQKKSVYIVFALAFLWLPAFGLTAWAQEAPGGGNVVDGTIQNVGAGEVSKGAAMIQAPGGPDSPQEAGQPQKPGAPEESGTSSAFGASPVITCGAGQSQAAPAVEKKEETTTTQWVSLGTFGTTGYCNCSLCSSGFSLTYSGTVPKAKHTISADLSLFPLGTQLRIDDVVYTVEDIGSAVTGRVLDIYYDSHENALAHGWQIKEVFISA